jgi:hypothetical protein
MRTVTVGVYTHWTVIELGSTGAPGMRAGRYTGALNLRAMSAPVLAKGR